MPPRKIRFYEAHRFFPIHQREVAAATRPIWRATLIYGPVLSLIALWIVHRAGALPPNKIGFTIGLLVAPFAFGVALAAHSLLMRIPKLAPLFQSRWELSPRGLTFMHASHVSGTPWPAVEHLEIERTAEEVTLHLTFHFRNRPVVRTITCSREDVTDDALQLFKTAVKERRFPGQSPTLRQPT